MTSTTPEVPGDVSLCCYRLYPIVYAFTVRYPFIFPQFDGGGGGSQGEQTESLSLSVSLLTKFESSGSRSTPPMYPHFLRNDPLASNPQRCPFRGEFIQAHWLKGSPRIFDSHCVIDEVGGGSYGVEKIILGCLDFIPQANRHKCCLQKTLHRSHASSIRSLFIGGWFFFRSVLLLLLGNRKIDPST